MRDRISAQSIQKILWLRGAGPAVGYQQPNEIQILFDGSKDTCLQLPTKAGVAGGFLTGDQLLFIFNEPEQIHAIEITNKASRTVAGFAAMLMATGITGDWEWVFPDPALANGTSAGAEEAVIDAKISAFAFTFGEDATNICEVVAKTFSHTIPAAIAPGAVLGFGGNDI